MRRAILTGLVASVLVLGLIFSPVFLGQAHTAQAQVSGGKTKKVLIVASEKDVQVAPDNPLHPGGVMYHAMVFNGTIPGPVVAMDQNDTLQVTLKNEGKLIHSMDFHAGYGTKEANSGPVKPGESKTWTVHGTYGGAFFYHCSADALNGIWEHIANGMYGGIIVHPENEKPAKEFYVVFGEIYNSADSGLFKKVNGTGSFDIGKFLNNQNDLALTNGMAFKYVPAIGSVAKIPLNNNAKVFMVKPNELTRWYLVNAGPNHAVSFHFIGGIIDVRDGFILNRYMSPELNEETWNIPPGSASVIESTFPQEGLYVGVNHALSDVLKGGAFAVLVTSNSTAHDQPPGSWVPPKGSSSAGAPNMTGGASNMTGGNKTA